LKKVDDQMYNSFILSEDRARGILHYTQCSVREEGFYSLSCEERWDSTKMQNGLNPLCSPVVYISACEGDGDEPVSICSLILFLSVSLPVRRGKGTCEYLFPEIIHINISTCKERVRNL
jgi:hypothetical protein